MPASSPWLLLAVLCCGLPQRPALALADPDFPAIDLPREHLPFYFKTFPQQAEACRNDDSCPYKDALDKDVCWGHEPNCPLEKAFQTPECPGDHKGWVKTKEAQVSTFYSQADFGYLKNQATQMKIICEPLFREDSALECSDHLEFCRGRNIMINFTELAKEPGRYKMDVLKPGQIGGYCTFHESRMKQQTDRLSPLQSWAPELRNFQKLLQRPTENEICDVVVERPTFIMKIDAAVNMYHHFCDFFNLYGSLHLNSSHTDSFSRDVDILIWETFSYYSSFSSAFDAFTKHPILDLNAYRGKVVCFKSVVFPLLPRMIFGLYYNTPIIYGCEKSGLFKAFNQFMLHRMRIDRRDSEFYSPVVSEADGKIRVTFLSRNTTYRRVLNEKRLLNKLASDGRFEVHRVDYNRQLKFLTQAEITHNSDIFIGMHGAGLTHLLFLPDWAVLFELYNCEDEHCYKDLARMRGIKYITWTNSSAMIQQDEGHHPEGGAHAKFTNYEFDPDEFMKLVNEAADHVQRHKQYREYNERLIARDEKLSREADSIIEMFSKEVDNAELTEEGVNDLNENLEEVEAADLDFKEIFEEQSPHVKILKETEQQEHDEL